MGLKSSYSNNWIEAGCDEAGRGCLSGPVCAAAVILPKKFSHTVLNDSKKISKKIRHILKEEIQETVLTYAVAMVDNQEIDEINILNASILAMHKALANLKIAPELVLVDGNKFKPYNNIPYQCIIGGDSKYLSIAAASILAKTYRDDYMKDIHLRYPHYQWDKNKGYPTKEHIQAIHTYGYSPFHRHSFHLKSDQLMLKF